MDGAATGSEGVLAGSDNGDAATAESGSSSGVLV
jgi:hypothetical protein